MSRVGRLRLVRVTAVAVAGLSLLSAAAPLSIVPRRDTALEAALRSHVVTLSSEEFGGREPGTDGEARTLRYLARQWFDIGLESGTNTPGSAWFAPVELVERVPAASRVAFRRGKQRLAVSQDGAFVVTSGLRSLVENAPVLFVGHGTGPVPPRAELAGRIALMLDSLPSGTSAAATEDRPGRLLDAGASAVIVVLDGERRIDEVTARRRRAGYALAGGQLGGDIEAFVTPAFAAQMLAGGAARDVATLRREAAAAGFVPRLLGVEGSLEATSTETRVRTHNLIGKIEGRNPAAGAVLVMAHWDHFGQCGTPPMLCPGAVDNASGVAVITEVARSLVRGQARGAKPMDRDVYFVATTGEELGLLGAMAFAENPPLPLDRVVAAFNVDSTGLVPAGRPVAIVGRGMTGLDAGIGRVVARMKRKLVNDDAANAFVRRQDSWALIQHDVPAVMVSSSYGDPERLDRFMKERYHTPADKADLIEVGGMADDVTLHTELVREFADAKRVPAPGSASGPTRAATP